MRKILFLTAVAALSLTANSQTSFGLKGGANLANLKFSVDGMSETYSAKFGGHGGFYANIPAGTNFRIQPEVLFSMEGAKFEDAKIALNYINVPVMFQYSASGFYSETGPQLGLLMSAKATEDGDTEDIKEDLETINLSLGFGAGYRLENGLGFGARYNLGLTNIIKDGDSEDGTLKSNVFQFGLSFSFGRSRK